MLGTLLNAGTIIAGSLVGMMIRSKLPEKQTRIVFQAIGLFTLAIGISLSLRSDRLIIAVISLVLGTLIGQCLDIDRSLERFSGWLHSRTGPPQQGTPSAGKTRFTEGFVTATMLFCVGSMSILGPIQDGMGETPDILITKSIMDGISSVVLASSFGIAILFSCVPVLIYQGTITIFAAFAMRWMSEGMIADLTAVGGILLIGLGINILEIKHINVTNMLPALVIVVFLSHWWG